MKLTDLNPELYDAGGPGILNADGSPSTPRTGVLLSFDCPKCGPELGAKHGNVMCNLNPAMDGTPYAGQGPRWNRTGETFETMTLEPSILVTPDHGRGCGAHFYIRNGEIVDC